MGNASMSRRDEAGPSGARSVENEEVGEEYMEYAHAPDPFPESMVQFSLHSPRAYHTPLNFTPQVSVTPLQRPEVKRYAKFPETRISTLITWRHEGCQVAIAGSWDNWKTREFLQRSNGDLTIMKVLPVGIYHYRFIVDGDWKCAPDLLQERDDMGNMFNILDLQEHILEREDNTTESESSPLSSYNNEYFSIKDFKEKVPELPPLLQRTPLNQPQSPDSPQSLEKPSPGVLNHLFIHKPPRGEFMTALSSTQRFRKKYVTVELYQSLKKM